MILFSGLSRFSGPFDVDGPSPLNRDTNVLFLTLIVHNSLKKLPIISLTWSADEVDALARETANSTNGFGWAGKSSRQLEKCWPRPDSKPASQKLPSTRSRRSTASWWRSSPEFNDKSYQQIDERKVPFEYLITYVRVAHLLRTLQICEKKNSFLS